MKNLKATITLKLKSNRNVPQRGHKPRPTPGILTAVKTWPNGLQKRVNCSLRSYRYSAPNPRRLTLGLARGTTTRVPVYSAQIRNFRSKCVAPRIFSNRNGYKPNRVFNQPCTCRCPWSRRPRLWLIIRFPGNIRSPVNLLLLVGTKSHCRFRDSSRRHSRSRSKRLWSPSQRIPRKSISRAVQGALYMLYLEIILTQTESPPSQLPTGPLRVKQPTKIVMVTVNYKSRTLHKRTEILSSPNDGKGLLLTCVPFQLVFAQTPRGKGERTDNTIFISLKKDSAQPGMTCIGLNYERTIRFIIHGPCKSISFRQSLLYSFECHLALLTPFINNIFLL